MNATTATCPVCQRTVKLSKKGKLARHGYKRGLGQYSQNIGGKSCIGSSSTLADLPREIAIHNNYSRNMAARESTAACNARDYTQQADNARNWLVANGHEDLANDTTIVPSWW
jgi:hypothetical protein